MSRPTSLSSLLTAAFADPSKSSQPELANRIAASPSSSHPVSSSSRPMSASSAPVAAERLPLSDYLGGGGDGDMKKVVPAPMSVEPGADPAAEVVEEEEMAEKMEVLTPQPPLTFNEVSRMWVAHHRGESVALREGALLVNRPHVVPRLLERSVDPDAYMLCAEGRSVLLPHDDAATDMDLDGLQQYESFRRRFYADIVTDDVIYILRALLDNPRLLESERRNYDAHCRHVGIYPPSLELTIRFALKSLEGMDPKRPQFAAAMRQWFINDPTVPAKNCFGAYVLPMMVLPRLGMPYAVPVLTVMSWGELIEAVERREASQGPIFADHNSEKFLHHIIYAPSGDHQADLDRSVAYYMRMATEAVVAMLFDALSVLSMLHAEVPPEVRSEKSIVAAPTVYSHTANLRRLTADVRLPVPAIGAEEEEENEVMAMSGKHAQTKPQTFDEMASLRAPPVVMMQETPTQDVQPFGAPSEDDISVWMQRFREFLASDEEAPEGDRELVLYIRALYAKLQTQRRVAPNSNDAATYYVADYMEQCHGMSLPQLKFSSVITKDEAERRQRILSLKAQTFAEAFSLVLANLNDEDIFGPVAEYVAIGADTATGRITKDFVETQMSLAGAQQTLDNARRVHTVKPKDERFLAVKNFLSAFEAKLYNGDETFVDTMKALWATKVRKCAIASPFIAYILVGLVGPRPLFDAYTYQVYAGSDSV